jgi:phosphatidylserine/phosphatidylglycerophosphate/cardiolipin synthase-like enzyme
VIKTLIDAGVPVFNAHHYNSTEFYYLHDKNLIIDGKVGGVASRLVLAGSNNFTEGGLIRNTESIIQIRDRAITNQFLANWTLIQSYSAPITQLSQLSAKAGPPLDPDNMEPTGR